MTLPIYLLLKDAAKGYHSPVSDTYDTINTPEALYRQHVQWVIVEKAMLIF